MRFSGSTVGSHSVTRPQQAPAPLRDLREPGVCELVWSAQCFNLAFVKACIGLPLKLLPCLNLFLYLQSMHLDVYEPLKHGWAELALCCGLALCRAEALVLPL